MPTPSVKRIDAHTVSLHGTVYTRERAIADLILTQACLNDPDRLISKHVYARDGSVPISVVGHLFGTWAEFKRQAGLAPTRHESAVLNSTARFAAADRLQSIRKERLGYGDLYLKDRGNRFKTVLIFSDAHDKDIDPFLKRVMVDTAKRAQPDSIVSGGDHFDMPEWSKYVQDPREFDLVGRLEAGLSIFHDLREACPDAEITLVEGNHEARLCKNLSESNPQMMSLLSDFHGMSMRQLLKLDQYEINYCAAFDLAAFSDAQIRREIRKNTKVLYDSLMIHHFPQGRHEGLPGTSGHHHQHIVWTEFSRDRGSYEWHQLGSACRRIASYTDGSRWNNGFMLANVDTQTREVMFDYVPVGVSFAVAGGQMYTREPEEV